MRKRILSIIKYQTKNATWKTITFSKGQLKRKSLILKKNSNKSIEIDVIRKANQSKS